MANFNGVAFIPGDLIVGSSVPDVSTDNVYLKVLLNKNIYLTLPGKIFLIILAELTYLVKAWTGVENTVSKMGRKKWRSSCLLELCLI